MRIPLVALFLLVTASNLSAFADTNLVGVWEAADRAHAAIYGFLKFSSTDVQFSLKGKRWECKTPYEIVAAGTDESFTEEVRPFPEGVRSWSYIKLRLGSSKCTDASHFIFAFLPEQTDHAGFVEFRNTHQWSGTGFFHRISGVR